MTQRKLAQMADLSEIRVRKIELSEVRTSMHPDKFRQLAASLGITGDELEAKIGVAAELDANIEPFSEQKISRIPLFDLEVAAGGWVEVAAVGEVCDPMQIDAGIFRVRVRGESMKPDWPNGSIVEFECLRGEHGQLVIGEDYYVQRSDGLASFKRLAAMGEEELVFQAINRRRFKESMPVNRRDVVKMAMATGTFTERKKKRK